MTTRSTRLVTKCMILYTLLKKIPSRVMCLENQILFMDICPVSMRLNSIGICYLSYPFVGELHYPNESRVIPNVATDIIPFIYPFEPRNRVSLLKIVFLNTF